MKRGVAVGISIIFMLLLFAQAEAYFLSPNTQNVPKANSTLAIYVSNSSVSPSPKLFYRKLSSTWKQCNMTGNPLNCTISAINVLDQDVYEYYFNDSSNRMPEDNGTFKIALSNGYEKIKNMSVLLINDEPDYIPTKSNGNGCSPWNATPDYTCEYEPSQAWMILGFLDAYYMTGNSTYMDKMMKMSVGNVSSPHPQTASCDHKAAIPDYDCNTSGQIGENVTASIRQGMMIYTYWSVYQLTGNSTIKAIAINYTKGHSEDCDVWAGNFSCLDSDGQGAMILGYWKAFEQTGNSTYRNMAGNLSDTGLSYNGTDYLSLGYWKAFEISGNSTYKQKARNITNIRLNSCQSGECSSFNTSLNIRNLMEAYEQTGNSTYRNIGYNKSYSLPSNCDPWSGNYSCGGPLQQGATSSVFWTIYQVIPYEETSRMYGMGIKTIPRTGNDMNITVGFKGIILKPVFYYREFGSSQWQSREISWDYGNVTLGRNTLNKEKIYEFYFNSETNRFPEGNGTFKYMVSLGNQTIKNTSASLTGTNPQNIDNSKCSPWGGSQDYSCELEDQQAWMMIGFANAYFMTKNLTYKDKMTKFASSSYDNTGSPGNRIYSECNHYDNDFDCDTVSGGGEKVTASIRQGMLIYSLWTAYQLTGNDSIRYIAINYSNGHSEDCDVWAGNFSCLDSDGQGAMILGYWKAFEQEGTDSYLDIANNISSAGLSYPDSDYLSLAYWKAFEMTGNDTYRQKALNITENRKNECNGNCTVINQSLNILSLLEAYEQTGNSSYKDTGLNRSFNFSDCDPFGGSYSCPRPIDQGSAINVFWELFRMTETGGVLNASLTYNLERSVYLGEEINITCSVNNTGFFPAQDVEVTINVTGGLNITQNLTKYATNISADNYMDFTWNATAVELGEQSIMCSVTSNVGGLDVFANVTIVSQPSGEPPGAPGPSSGPPIGIAAPTKKLEIEGMPTSVNLYFGRDETITFFLKNTGEKNLTISGFTWDSDQVDLSMYPLYFSLDSGKMAEVTLTLRQLNQIYTELPLEITIITEEDYEKKTQIRLFILSCVPYDVTCENGVMRSCDEYGFGFEETYCEQGCDGNGCLVRICEPDTSTCAGGVLTECSSDGKEQWINECENGCSETGDRCLVAKMGISPANIFFLSVIFYCFFILSSMGALFSGRYYMKYGRVTYYSVGDYLQRRIRNLVERNKSDKLFEIHKLLEELYMKTEKDHPKSKTIEKQMSEMKRVLETFVILEVMEDKKREMKILPKDIQKLKTNFADTTAKIKDDEIRNKFEKRFKKMGL